MINVLNFITIFKEYEEEIDIVFTPILIVLIPTLLIILWRNKQDQFLLSGFILLVDIGAVILCFVSSSALFAVIQFLIYFIIRMLINQKLKPKKHYQE